MKKFITALSILATTLVIAPAVQAHHGPGQFNGGDVTVTGTITKIRFVNPHGYIYFDAKDENGKTEAWRCELQAGSLLRRAGWTEEIFPIGGEITVEGSAGTNERTACALNSVILPDGSELSRYGQLGKTVDHAKGSSNRVVAGKLDLNGTWAAPQRAIETAENGGDGGMGMGGGMGPRGGMGGPGGDGGLRLPNGITALTDAGKAAAEARPAAGNPRHDCKATSIFFDWTFDRHVNEIIQNDETITLRYGLMDIERTIYLNTDTHPNNIEPSVAGHSIGRWEGGASEVKQEEGGFFSRLFGSSDESEVESEPMVLVVETTGLSVDSNLFGTSLVNSPQASVVEKFSYDAESQALTRTYSAVDPTMMVGTLTGEDKVYPSNIPFEAYECIELKDDLINPI